MNSKMKWQNKVKHEFISQKDKNNFMAIPMLDVNEKTEEQNETTK